MQLTRWTCWSELPLPSPPGIALAALIRHVLTDDGSDVFAAQRWLQQMRVEPVNDLELLHLAGAGKKIDERPVERQGRQLARLELRHRDVLDEGSLRVSLGVRLVETIDILDQRMVDAAITLGEQKTACVRAVRRYAADTRRVLPDGERRVAVADYGRGRLDKERQHVSENFRRDRHHAVRREQRPEEVGIAESGDDSQLRQHAGRQAQLQADRRARAAANHRRSRQSPPPRDAAR